ncbi:retrovirus-related pol polyprotein from transposon TNT 1-94 [Tanacetum coccineum]
MVMEQKFIPTVDNLVQDVNLFYKTLNEEMVTDLRYFNSLEEEVESLQSQLKTQENHFSNEIDRLLQEYFYDDYMSAILGVYTDLEEYSDMACNVNTRNRKPMAVPTSNRDPKRIVNQYIATPHRKIVASKSTIQDPRNRLRKLYENVIKTCKWWYMKLTSPGYKWEPNSKTSNLIEIILFIIDSGCTKHMMGNLKLLINFVEKFLGMVRFGNDQFAPILGYGDLVQGNISIKYTWTHFLRSKDEPPEVLKNFLKMIQRNLQAQVITVRTDRDGENLDKMKEKGDACIFVGYATLSKGYRVYNKRTRMIVETIHVNFDKLPRMVLDQNNSSPAPQSPEIALAQNSVSPSPECQATVSEDNTLGPAPQPNQVVSKSFDVTTADAPNQRQQPNITQSTSTTVAEETIPLNTHQSQEPIIQPTITINAEGIIGNPSHLVRTIRQLDTDGEMFMFALTVSRAKPKNIKEAMTDHAWIESMQEELHQFDRLDV